MDMQSQVVAAIGMKLEPVALVWTDEKPAQAVEFAANRWGCVMFHLALAAKGKTAVVSRETFGCFGGGVGLGFGNKYRDFPGGEECFCHFLSDGNADSAEGRAIGQQMAEAGGGHMADDFLHGERYLKDPKAVAQFVRALPMTDIPAKYVVFKPLSETDLDTENVRSITFFADPDQLAALVVLANYEADTNENVVIPFAAGCQSIGIYVYRECEKEQPRAVVGLVDISARNSVRKQLGADVMSFSVPPSLFRRMEQNVPGSFLERPSWQTLKACE
jgi:uncharacterized protein (DUF169 family)